MVLVKLVGEDGSQPMLFTPVQEVGDLALVCRQMPIIALQNTGGPLVEGVYRAFGNLVGGMLHGIVAVKGKSFGPQLLVGRVIDLCR